MDLRNCDLEGKKVIIRCDFNVPIKDGVIRDDNRIVESLPTIKFVQLYETGINKKKDNMVRIIFFLLIFKFILTCLIALFSML